MKERRLNRLHGYDYSQVGYYFVTICTQNRMEWFGKIDDGKMVLNEYGQIVLACWCDLPNHYHVALDMFVIMPNHIHGIIIVGNGLKPFPTKHGLSEIVRGFKTFSSRKINEMITNDKNFHWQKSFYDHIVRNEMDLNRVREYIINNPQTWELDEDNLG